MDIGIFGGSFNPIHIGHLIAAEEVFHQQSLSKVIFIPTGISPHKESRDLIDASHRYRMVKDAIHDNGHFEVSDVEIKRSGRSYTIDTIKAFKEVYGEQHNLYLIVGTDMINEISTWKEIDTLSRICRFIVVNRFPVTINKSIVSEDVSHNNKFYADHLSTRDTGDIFLQSPHIQGVNRGREGVTSEKQMQIEILKVTIPPIGISSTEIRNRLYHGCSIRYLVPRCVEDYIMEKNLYRKTPVKS